MISANDIVIRYDPRGRSGNIYWIIGALRHEYIQRGMTVKEFKPIFDRVTASRSYDEALGVIREYATLIEEESA